jgi:hypothetical protein
MTMSNPDAPSSNSTWDGSVPISLQLMRRHTVSPTNEAVGMVLAEGDRLGEALEKRIGPDRRGSRREGEARKPKRAD